MKTRKISSIGMALLIGTIFSVGSAGSALARTNVGVSINIGPPPIVVPAPPSVVLVPNSQVYFVPGVEFDVFFYNGYWWSPRGDRWYRSHAYNGPWKTIDRRYIPGPVYRVPHDYRNVYGHERHIPYGEWKHHDRGHHRGHGGDGGKHHEGGGGHGHGHGHGD